MMRSALVVCLSLLFATTALTAASKSKDVSYKSGNETVHGILYTPQGKGPFPGLIVIHEWWGLNDWVKEQASKLSDQGYVALAIDLYRGKVATTPNEAHEFMGGVPQERAKRDLQAAFDYLESQSDVKKGRIGAIGWCMGGGYALQLALDEPKLTADVINYGVYDYESLANNPAAVQKINASILGLYGAQDRGIPVADLRKFFQELIKEKKKADFEIYPDAGHAFENPNNKDGYRPKDAEKAWSRTVTFLATTLKK
jgi:carboxymethylenebutenolidase